MPAFATQGSSDAMAALTAHTWTPQPEPARLVQRLLDECLTRSSFAARLSKRMLDETGTRLIDWIDHFSLPASDSVLRQLGDVGYVRGADGQSWEHPKGLFPRIRSNSVAIRDLAIK